MTVAEFRDLFDLDGPNPRDLRRPRAQKRAKYAVDDAGPLTIDHILVQVPLYNLKLNSEQTVSVGLYRALVQERRAGRCRCVFTCIANELPIPAYNDSLKKMAGMIGQKRRAMGTVPGASDWIFTWRGNCLWAELKEPGGQVVMRKVKRVGYDKMHPVKTPPGRLRPEQAAFQAWCDEMGVPKATWHSVEQALDHLRSVGALAT